MSDPVRRKKLEADLVEHATRLVTVKLVLHLAQAAPKPTKPLGFRGLAGKIDAHVNSIHTAVAEAVEHGWIVATPSEENKTKTVYALAPRWLKVSQKLVRESDNSVPKIVTPLADSGVTRNVTAPDSVTKSRTPMCVTENVTAGVDTRAGAISVFSPSIVPGEILTQGNGRREKNCPSGSATAVAQRSEFSLVAEPAEPEPKPPKSPGAALYREVNGRYPRREVFVRFDAALAAVGESLMRRRLEEWRDNPTCSPTNYADMLDVVVNGWRADRGRASPKGPPPVAKLPELGEPWDPEKYREAQERYKAKKASEHVTQPGT